MEGGAGGGRGRGRDVEEVARASGDGDVGAALLLPTRRPRVLRLRLPRLEVPRLRIRRLRVPRLRGWAALAGIVRLGVAGGSVARMEGIPWHHIPPPLLRIRPPSCVGMRVGTLLPVSAAPFGPETAGGLFGGGFGAGGRGEGL